VGKCAAEKIALLQFCSPVGRNAVANDRVESLSVAAHPPKKPSYPSLRAVLFFRRMSQQLLVQCFDECEIHAGSVSEFIAPRFCFVLRRQFTAFAQSVFDELFERRSLSLLLC